MLSHRACNCRGQRFKHIQPIFVKLDLTRLAGHPSFNAQPAYILGFFLCNCASHVPSITGATVNIQLHNTLCVLNVNMQPWRLRILRMPRAALHASMAGLAGWSATCRFTLPGHFWDGTPLVRQRSSGRTNHFAYIARVCTHAKLCYMSLALHFYL